MNIGTQVKQLRELRKVSVAELSNNIEVSRSLLYRFEKGKSNVSISTLEKILEQLNGKVLIITNYENK